jgi:hypothetical protein
MSAEQVAAYLSALDELKSVVGEVQSILSGFPDGEKAAENWYKVMVVNIPGGGGGYPPEVALRPDVIPIEYRSSAEAPRFNELLVRVHADRKKVETAWRALSVDEQKGLPPPRR